MTFVTDMEKVAGKLDIAFGVDQGNGLHFVDKRMGRPGWLFGSVSLVTGVNIADQAVKWIWS